MLLPHSVSSHSLLKTGTSNSKNQDDIIQRCSKELNDSITLSIGILQLNRHGCQPDDLCLQ